MAMLVMNDVFARTWGDRVGSAPESDYWPTVIPAVREAHPGFLFLAEAYWDLERALQQQGFNYCYDKRLYDWILHGPAEQVHLHLLADDQYQHGLLRFVENHDEPRAVSAFGSARSQRPDGGSDGAPSGVSWPIPVRTDRSRFDQLLPLVPNGHRRSDLPRRSLAALRSIRLAWR